MLTPLDIENKRFSKTLKGYNVDEVDDFLDQLTLEYEKLYKENAGYREQIEQSKKDLEHYKDVEHTDRNGKKWIEKVYVPADNHSVVWTLSIRLFDIDIATLYGRKPSELIECINLILEVLNGKYTLFYVHNLSFDYTYLRKFLFKAFGNGCLIIVQFLLL